MNIDTLKRKSSTEEQQMETKKTKISNPNEKSVSIYNILLTFNKHFPRTPEEYSQEGPVHHATFNCVLTINDKKYTGQSNTKKKAKQEAVQIALKELLPSALTSKRVVLPRDRIKANREDKTTSTVVEAANEPKQFKKKNSDAIAVPALVANGDEEDEAAATTTGDNEPVKAEVKPAWKSATAILHAIWPLIQFKMLEPTGGIEAEMKMKSSSSTVNRTVVVEGDGVVVRDGVVVDSEPAPPPVIYVAQLLVEGKIYKDSATSAKAVKAKLAGRVLSEKFQLKFTSAPDGFAYYEGPDTDWVQYKAKVEEVPTPEICEGKHPIQFLKELYPAALFQQDVKNKEKLIESGGNSYTISIEIEGKTYKGESGFKKVAKTKCCVQAIEGLQMSGILMSKLEKRKKHAANKKMHLAKYKDKKNFESMGNNAPYSNNGYNTCNNNSASNVIRLAAYFPTIQYELVSQETSPVNGQPIFSIRTTVQGDYFIGTGQSAEVARENVACMVLNKYGLDNEVHYPNESQIYHGKCKWNNYNTTANNSNPQTLKPRGPYTPIVKQQQQQDNRALLKQQQHQLQERALIGLGSTIIDRQVGTKVGGQQQEQWEGGYTIGPGQMGEYKEDDTAAYMNAYETGATMQIPSGMGYEQQTSYGYKEPASSVRYQQVSQAVDNRYQQLSQGVEDYRYQQVIQGVDNRLANPQLHATNGGKPTLQGGQGTGAYASLGASHVVTGGVGVMGNLGRIGIGSYVTNVGNNSVTGEQDEEYKYFVAANSAYQQQQQSTAAFAAGYGANDKFINFYQA